MNNVADSRNKFRITYAEIVEVSGLAYATVQKYFTGKKVAEKSAWKVEKAVKTIAEKRKKWQQEY